jgi:hypothetical protein
MDNTLFYKKYDSESIVDVFRDISECFDKDYNPNAIKLDGKNSVLVYFFFQDGPELQDLLNRVYDSDSYCDIEQNIGDSMSGLAIEKDEYGFFEGDLIVSITVQ